MTIFALFSVLSYGQTTDLIISEYGEGSSSNKYIEIFNGTGLPVDLSQYQLWRISNGGIWPEATYTFTVTSLSDGDVITIANNDTNTPDADDYNSGFCSWNGDDAVGLAKDDGSGTFVLIDAIGTDGDDPGSGWDVAGITDATKNHYLVRKSTICSPNIDWSSSAGTDETDSEWIVDVLDGTPPVTFNSHTTDCTPSTTPTLNWSTTIFTEAAANDGSIGNQISLILENESFATVGATLGEGTDYLVDYVPSGLAVSIITTSATEATIALTGNAVSHSNADDINTLEITFKNEAFTGGDASAVENFSKTDLVVDFDDPIATANLEWSETTFNEDIANDGSISNNIILTLTGETFTTIGTLLIEGTDYIVDNVPEGLNLGIIATSETTAGIGLSGNAINHANADDISNLEVTFKNPAFTGGNASVVANYSKTDLVVDFIDPPVLVWSAITFVEDIANDGSFSMSIDLTLLQDTFRVSGGATNLELGTHYTVDHVPAGLTVNIDAYTNSEASITLQGNATSHLSTDNISDLTITFLTEAFTTYTAEDVENSSNNALTVNFFDPFSTPDLVITEIMYNGPESGTDSIEFIEVYNNTAENINLLGYTMEGVTHTFGDVTIDAQTFGVLCYNSEAYNNTYGSQTIAWTTGGLSNGGETIRILNPVGDLIDEVTYNNSGDWPSISNTSENLGHSIVLCDLTSDNNVGTNWSLSLSSVGIQIDGKDVYASPGNEDEACDLSIGESIQNNLFSIYPNPVNDILTIEVENSSRVEIMDINGKIVKTLNILSKKSIDVSDLTQGIYFIKTSSKEGVKVSKLVKL